MRRFVLIAVAGLGLFLGSRTATKHFWLAASPAPRPFTAEGREERYGADGKLAKSQMFIHAQRTDGSTVTIMNYFDRSGKPTVTKWIMDLSAKKRIAAVGTTESLSTTNMSDDEVAWERTKQAKCSAEDGAVRTTMLGLSVVRTAITRDTTTTALWQAPDLGCYPLRVEAAMGLPDGRRAVTTKQIMHIIPGDPDPSLFAVPSWPEMAPAAQDLKYMQKYGRRLYSGKGLAKAETLYERRQKK